MKRYLPYLCVVLGAACWGTIGVFNRQLAAAGVTMGTTVVLRNTGALVLLTVYFLCFRRQVFHIHWRHLPLFLGSGLISVVGLSWTYFTCQRMCSLAVAAILLYLAPSFVVIAGAVLWKAPLTPRRIAALALSLAGCALVSGVAGGDLEVSATGLLLGVAAGMCYASYTVFAHYALEHYDSYTMTYWTFVAAGLGALVFLRPADLAATLSQPQGRLGALGLAVVSTVLPYLLYTRGLEGVESGLASVMANVEPVVAALIGILLFHEVPDLWTGLGIALVLCGVVLLAAGKEKANGKA